MKNETLATELLHQLKASARRWFIAFCIMVGLEICTVVGFIWYISLPSEDVNYEQNAEDNGNNQIIGGDNNGN